jgi:hypothetical protein
MRRVLITLVTVSLAAVAHAGSGPYFLEVTGAYNRLEMGTVNEFLDSVNEEAGQTVVDRLEAGGSWGVNLGRVYNDRMATAIGYERLDASVRSSPPLVMHLHAPANILSFKLAYALARWGSVIPLVQGTAGWIWNDGYLEYQDPFGNNVRHDFGGGTLALEAMLGAEVRLSDRFGLNLTGGYRYADVSSPDWDGTSFGGTGRFTGPGFDYSGVVVRLGLRIGLDWTGLGGSDDTRDTSQEATGWM